MTEQKTSECDPLRRRLRSAARCASWLLAIVTILSCQKQARHAMERGIRGEPGIAATVLTIQTNIQPENKTFVHSLVIADDRARSGDEVDQWRLFDFGKNTVTYVDDVAKTFRTMPMSTVLADFKAAMTRPMPAGMPVVSLVTTGSHRVIQGTEADEVQLRAGSYIRQLWMAKHPLVPPKLFAMMLASAPSRSPLAPIAKTANDALMKIDGFPFAEHSELGFDTNKKLMIDQTVVRIEKRNVPQSWLNVPVTYTDITPPPPAPRPEKHVERRRK